MWIDPNETSEVALANSRKFALRVISNTCTPSGRLSCVRGAFARAPLAAVVFGLLSLLSPIFNYNSPQCRQEHQEARQGQTDHEETSYHALQISYQGLG